jgi:hypothetical protein
MDDVEVGLKPACVDAISGVRMESESDSVPEMRPPVPQLVLTPLAPVLLILLGLGPLKVDVVEDYVYFCTKSAVVSPRRKGQVSRRGISVNIREEMSVILP